ncbi:MAG: YitT family protein [Lachnospiraceae bacterium]|jgi:uncharacterized membrane-anchored protein YitT (DUF2179 family)|nr:YitT family protein [Lachnospiraceae bacterium]
MNQNNRTQQMKYSFFLVLGSVIYGIGTHCFVMPANIAPGGAVGLALIINYLSGLPVGILTIFLNIPLLVLAWFMLSKRFVITTGIACGVCSVILDFGITPFFPVYGGDRLMSSLFGGILVGIGMACIFMTGSTTGGTDILGYIFQKKKPHISIGKALLMVDGVILLLSIFVFENVEAGLFGLISLFAQTRVMDAIIYGNDIGSMVTIVTRYPENIMEGILVELERSATVMDAKGAYSGADVKVLLCSIRKHEFYKLKRIIYAADPNAFIMVTETTEVFGEGFKGMDGQ